MRTVLIVRMIARSPPSAAALDPARYFANSVDGLFEYLLRELHASDMLCVVIHNADNQRHRHVELSFRWKVVISRVVTWNAFEKVMESND